MQVRILGDDPRQYLDVLFTPVLLDLFIFDHLVDSTGDHPHDGLVTDVVGDNFFGFVELRTMGYYIAPELSLPVLMKILYKFRESLLGFEQGLV